MTTQEQWLILRVWAEQFEDVQKARIAAVNRAERGGVDPSTFADYINELAETERICKNEMARAYRNAVPTAVREWQQASHGIGQHLLGRLLGHLGHPVDAFPHHWEGTGSNRKLIADEPYRRTVGQLWQYCGHGAPARRVRGMTADDAMAQGKPKLKMIVHLLAEACMKQQPDKFYRAVYDRAKEDVTDKVHSVECIRCGPSGNPAQPGSPWSDGHKHAHALRIVGKEILRDLWLVAGGGVQVYEAPPVSDRVEA